MSLLGKNLDAPTHWQGILPVPSRYTYGIAGERFFREIKDKGRIMGAHCYHCDHTYVPAVLFCERCLNQLEEWVDIGIEGEVHTFTVLHLNVDGSQKEEPEIVAFVKMKDGGIVHHIKKISPNEVRIGLRVEAVIKPPSERVGSILDIRYFQPVSNSDS